MALPTPEPDPMPDDQWDFVSSNNKPTRKKDKKTSRTIKLQFTDALSPTATEETAICKDIPLIAPSLPEHEPFEPSQLSHLFTQCLGCLRCDYISISGPSIPQALVQGINKCGAALLMVQCGTCARHDAPPRVDSVFGMIPWDNEQPRGLKLHKNIVKDSRIHKFAEATAGGEVYVVSNGDHLVFMRADYISRHLTTRDTMNSIGENRGDEDISLVKLPFVRLGFV